MTRHLTPLTLILVLAACGKESEFDFSKTQGPNPVLVAPDKSLLPTVNVASADGWPAGKMPVAAEGLKVAAFASGIEHPRTLLQTPNGDVLVALTDAPGTDKSGGAIKGKIQAELMKKAGSHKASANQILLLRDANGDGVAEQKSVLIDHDLMSPYGMAIVGDELVVANADALIAFPYKAGETTITAQPRRIAALPAGYNHHWTKALLASPDGRFLYVGVGSNSNIGENGMAMEKDRAAIWKVDAKTGAAEVVAGGIRNPTALAWSPAGELWTVANERDELGNDLVPDYLTHVKKGGFYGWPWSYWGQNVDERVKPAAPDMVAKAIAPDYALGSHVAPLGLAFSGVQKLGTNFASGVFVSEHGSWNRKPWSGYQLVFIPFNGARPDPEAKPIPILTGFRVDDTAYGRPVGVMVAKDGSVLVADDVGNAIWRLTAAR